MTGKQKVEESRYRTLFEAANDSIFILKDCRFVECNRMTLKMFGCEKESDILGSYPWDFSPASQPDGLESKEKAVELMGHTLGGRPQRFYWRHIRKDGGEFDAEISLNLLETEETDSLLAIVRDITKQKRAEEALRESEEKFRLLIENIPSVSWTTSEYGETTFISPVVEKIYGFTQKEIYEKGKALWFGRIHPDDIDKVRGSFERMFTEGTAFDVEYRIQRKDGKWIWVHDMAIMAYAEDGVKYAYGVFSDITERKQSLEALRESEAKMRSIFRAAPIGIGLVSDRIHLDVNERLCEITGYSRDELIGKNARMVYPTTEEYEYVGREKYRQIKEKGTGVVETRFKRKDGKIIHVLLSSTPIDPADHSAGVTFTALDITDRKRAEEALQKSAVIIDRTSDAVITTDVHGKITFWNKGAERIYGYREEEALGRPISMIYKEEDLSVLESMIAGLLDGEVIPNIEVTCIDKNRDEVYILLSLTTIKNKDGRITELIGITKEITERKQAEKEQKKLQAQLSNALEMAHLGPWEADIENNLFTFNDYFYKIFRTTAEQVGGYTLKSDEYAERFVHPDDIPLIGEAIQEAIETDDPHFNRQLEHRILYADGTVGYITVRFFIVKDAQGKTIRTYGVNQDITERKRVEEALRESEERFRMLFNSINDAVFVHQPSTEGNPGKFIEVNDVACQRYGYSREELFELTPSDLVIPEQKEDARMRVKRLLSEKSSVFEILHRTKAGKEFPVEISAHLFDLHDRPTILSIVRDITDRKRAEEERRDLEAQLLQAQKLESIGTLAGGIAHDFNNILSPIMVYSEMAMMDLPQESPIQQNLQQIHKAGERARELVKQILTFARRREEDRIPLRASQIVKEAINFLRSTIPTTIYIQYDCKTEQDAVLADPTQMNQIVMNLCTNAAHAMREKGGTLGIILKDEHIGSDKTTRIAGLSPGHYLRLSVRDTGPGIPPDIIDKIFEPYFTTKAPGEGTGMGLALSHGIVKSYGGDIGVESEIGKGTTFHVLLPVVEEDPSLVTVHKVPLPGGEERILFVDDEKEAVDAIQSMLEKLGYKVTSRTSSIEALEAFRHKPDAFDLVITDQTMPNMTGRELAEELMSIRSDIPIILCTGFSVQIDERRAKEMGISAFVMKPILIREMADTIREVLDSK